MSFPRSRKILLDNYRQTGWEHAVIATVEGEGANRWARLVMCTILGQPWTGDSPDFAYAVLEDAPDLIARVRAEGYDIDLSMYSDHFRNL